MTLSIRHNPIIRLWTMVTLGYLGASFFPRINPSWFSKWVRFYYILSLPVYFLVVTMIGAFTLSYRIIGAVIKRKKSFEISNSILIGILLTYLLFVPFYLLHRTLPPHLPSGSDLKSFQSTQWKGGADRPYMLKDLVRNVLPNKSKDEIITLLGNSTKTDYFQAMNYDLIYAIGPERDGFLNLDSEWLLIWFDNTGKFKKYRLMVD